ncbi:MAG: sulfatase-like hydrolase/transferase [Niameybacter sp.]|uniref:sulfatase-like hydrolase/transferase n=1 Tax=Niameybacter sp. TaxID=2033640 RepID=UPI002FC935F7
MEQKMQNRPNIIFYFSDQQRWDTVGCYGQKLDVTPHLDQLAKEGIKFEYAFTCQPVCGPARSCLQLGQYATNTGCFTNGIAPDFTRKMLADYFNEAGYETAYVGKWHLATDESIGEDYVTTAIPEGRRGGYKDYWMASDVLEFTSHGYNGYVFDKENQKREFIGYRADCINNYAIDYIRNKQTDDPFFLFISQIEPHHQNDRDRYEGPDGSKARFKDYEKPGDLAENKGDWKMSYPDYLGCCHSLDKNVGRLVETLKEKGIYENTIIIYTSDHGSHFKTRNSEYKRSCHEGCIRVPLIVHGPGFKGGKVINELVSLIDLPPTLLECAQIEVPEAFEGHSIRPLTQGQMSGWQEDVFLQISESQIGRAIRTKQYKYAIRAQGDPWKVPSETTFYEDYLYNLEEDPHEQNNLIEVAAYEGVREKLRERMKKRMEEVEKECPIILSSSERPL